MKCSDIKGNVRSALKFIQFTTSYFINYGMANLELHELEWGFFHSIFREFTKFHTNYILVCGKYCYNIFIIVKTVNKYPGSVWSETLYIFDRISGLWLWFPIQKIFALKYTISSLIFVKAVYEHLLEGTMESIWFLKSLWNCL